MRRTLTWAARLALVLAILAAFGLAPGGALAVHDDGLFELDGNATDEPLAGDDWSTLNGLGLPGGSFSHVFVPYSSEGPGTDASYFTGGGSKDTNDVSSWQASPNDVAPDKNEITDAYAASYATSTGHTIVYFGMDRYDTSGDSNVGFWFFQNGVSLNADGTFSGVHTNGDVFVVSSFTNGGSVPMIDVYQWQSGSLVKITDGAGCTADDMACAAVNSSPITVNWYYADKAGDPVGSIPATAFFEGGIDLTTLFAPRDIPCFSTFLAETRSSQSPSAQLKDLALGSVNSCGSITIKKEANPESSQSFGFTASGADAKVANFSLVDNGDQTSNVRAFSSIRPGTYSISENDPGAVWNVDQVTCTTSGNGTSATPSGRSLSVTLGAGGNVDCTYFNSRKPTLTVTKDVVPSNDAGTFDLKIDGTTKQTGGNGATTGPVVVSAGPHSVSEAAAAGATLSDYDTVIGGDCAADGSVTLAAGQSKTCTITNTRKPRLTVTKILAPAGDAGRFGLQIDGDTKASGGNGTTTGALPVGVGSHRVGETGVTGTDLAHYETSIGGACDADGNVALGPGDDKTCMITNRRKPTLTVTKVLVPAADGGTFDLRIDGGTKATGGNGATTHAVEVAIGSHTVSEAAANGTDASKYVAAIGGDCAADGSVSLGAGDAKSCTITNTRKPRLIVIKKVVNDNGGTTTSSDFQLAVTAANATPASFAGADDPGVDVTLDPGPYKVAETGAASGYTATTSAGCEGSIAAGQTKTCTVTNDDQPGKLIVIKKVVNDDGGTADASDFSFTVSGASPSPATFAGADAPGVPVTLDAGDYSVAESGGPSGYTPSLSADCSGSIAIGQTKTCTVTNDDRPAKLVVIKKVVNDNGGTAGADDFTFEVSGSSPSPASFKGADAPGVAVGLAPGPYSVSETGGPSGYAKGASDDCDGSIALGETKTCTVTNDDVQPKLVVVKKVVNDDGGTADAGDFTLSVAGSSPSPASFKGADEPGVTVGLDAGEYNVTETGGPAGYGESFSGDCTGSISIGETKTCTVTNNDRAATLIVVKKVVNDDGGTATAADFTLDVAGTNATPTSFKGSDDPGVSVSLSAGSYSVGETGGPSGYAATLSADCAGSIAIGQTKTCTVTNDDRAATLIVVKKVVNDDGGTAGADDFTFAVSGSNPTPASFKGAATPGVAVALRPGSYSVAETGGPSGYAGSASADCTGSIALGETKTCTVTNDDVQPKLIVIKKVVNDDGGTAKAADFTLEVTGTHAAPGSFKGADEPGVTVSLSAGNYAVAERATASGYAPGFSADCSGSIAVGQTKTCTVTNDDVQPKLIVVKKVVNDNGGTAKPEDFTLSVSGAKVNPASFKGADEPGVTVSLSAGSYAVTEPAVPSAYTASYSADCSGSIGTGQTKTCTVTNNDVAPPPPMAPPVPEVVPPPPPPAPTIDLAVTKTDRPDPASIGGRLTYTLVVRNNGPDTATGVVLDDPLPARTSFVSVASSTGRCSGGAVIHCDLGTLAPRATVTIRVVVRPRVAGMVVNTATVVGNEAESNRANNTATAITLVRGSFVPPVVKHGCYAITVTTRATIVGRRTPLVMRVTELGRPAKGARVRVTGVGITRLSPRSDTHGMIRMLVLPRRAGIIRVTASGHSSCGTSRIGVVGAFTPPVTG